MNIITNIFDNKIFNDKVAIAHDNHKISYNELKNRITYTSYLFREKGIKKNDIVAILLPRGTDFVVTIMSLFYLGATALPLDINTPKDRLNLVLADVKHVIDSFPNYNESNLNFLPEEVCQYDIAYIVYTSGSSGAPKKIEISYAALFRYCKNLNSCINVSESDIYAFTASIGFSSMFRQIFIPLLNAAELLIMTDEERTDPVLFINKASKATIIDLIPSFYDSVCIYLERKELANIFKSSAIRLSLSASEPLKVETLKKIISCLPKGKFINMYGLTETCGIITTYLVDNNLVEKLIDYYVPIGKPIPETAIQLNNSGELLVSSPLISHNVSLTNHYYNTGDAVKLDADGNLIYVSRNDRQIKISGKRINLVEIDRNIELFSAIEKSVSIFDERSKKIITYVKIKQNIDNLHQALRSHAKNTLIAAMVPSEFYTIEEFPLTSSRKLDYRQLITLHENMVQTSIGTMNNSYVWNSWEKLIYESFSEQLQKFDLKPTDNLFDIGADSLKMAIAMAKITNGLGIDIRLNEVIANPTITGLAALIRRGLKSDEIRTT